MTTRKVSKRGFSARKYPAPEWAVTAANLRLEALMADEPVGNVSAELRCGAYIGNDDVPYVLTTYIDGVHHLDHLYKPRDENDGPEALKAMFRI